MLDELFEQSPDGCYFMLLDVPATGPRDSEALVDHLLEHARLVRANAALARQHGVSRARLLGRRPTELPGFAVPDARAHLRRMLVAGSTHVVHAVRSIGGRELWIDGHYRALFDEEGRVLGFLGVQRDITHVRRLQDELEAKATTDPLTGAGNRRLLEERFAQYAAAGARRITLLYIDLDGFKRINDHAGHGAGDLALARYVRRLRAMLRADDALVRIGGDEFVVLAPHATREDDDALIRRVREPTDLGVPSGEPLALSCSVGVVHYPGDGTELPRLLELADRRMYLAKARGSGAAEGHDPLPLTS
jgi:diguanylate cyclase (GGDEF)-like protein/PAS domain S-box-containing protein